MYTRRVKKNMYAVVSALLFLFTAASSGFAQNIDLAKVDASDALRMGIVSFQSGEYNKAILSLEKSLSYKSDWNVTKIWLGNAYFKAGFTDQALSYWRDVLKNGGGSTTLKVRVDNLQYKRNMGPLLKGDSRYVTYHEIDGVTDNYTLFLRPGSAAPSDDGGLFVTSFGGDKILKISANGVKTLSFSGGVRGISHPFDIIKTGGYLFFSAYGSDEVMRSSMDGRKMIRFGSSGSGPGQFLGPQYIAADGNGYIFVTDEGNKRVSKFSYDGAFIFSFGRKRGAFPGFSEPTGIAYTDNNLLVADKHDAVLYLFDKSGNFIRSFPSDVLKAPEGISTLPDGRFLLADSGRVLVFNRSDETFRVVTESAGKNSLVLKAVEDVNGDIVVTDFNRNKILYAADISRMYTGLDVSIDRVVSSSFPKVNVELSVSAIDGTPLVGLEENNFLVTEHSYPVSSAKLVYTGNASKTTHISLLLEGSLRMAGKTKARLDVLEDILKAQKGSGTVAVVTAKEVPVLDSEGTSDHDVLSKAVIPEEDYTRNWQFDLGVRLAASRLVQKSDRRAVVFLTTGKLPPSSFSHYSLDEVYQFLINNHITFYTVYTGTKSSLAPELTYLSRKTGGEVLQLYRPAGVGRIVDDIQRIHMGTYVLTYTTKLDSDFGRRALPVEVQVSLFGRSGRGESLYYAPLR